MRDQAKIPRRGHYTANLLGNIRSHLAGLQGYDIMGLELIQNADDSNAEEVSFDITDKGLVVRNSGKFSYCGNLDTRPCSLREKLGYDCDYHRIIDVGSGGKLLQNENIGRFGIGFVSTYQITDRPEIRSAGISLALAPESGEWIVNELQDEPDGTTLFLPWAQNPDSATRRALGISHIGPSHIDEIVKGIACVLQHSLLFLRHVRKAEVLRAGELVLGCELDRGDGADLIVSFQPTGEIEQWHILRADAADAAQSLYSEHPRLESLGRSTAVAIGLRVEPRLLPEGRLYAFLPTEQSTGLPLHINADFFPESDRKHVIFAGHQHEQAWNEMLVEAAAQEIARDLEGLLEMLGRTQLWAILGKAYELSTHHSNFPECYRRIWEHIKVAASQACIVETRDGSVQRPDKVYLPPSPLKDDQAKVLLEFGGQTATEKLRPFRNAIQNLGARILTFERLVTLLEYAMPEKSGTSPVDNAKVAHFYQPLWKTVEELLPVSENHGQGNRDAVERLKWLPLVVTEHLLPVSINESYAVPPSFNAEEIAASLPGLAVISHHFVGYPKLSEQVWTLDLDAMVEHIRSRIGSVGTEEIVGSDPAAQRQFYELLVKLDDCGESDNTVYQALRDLPIWPSIQGLIPATDALLPGDFKKDPIGHSNLIDIEDLSDRVRRFLNQKLQVETQTIQAYVKTVLPRYFSDDRPIDARKYGHLVTELAGHSSLVNDEDTRKLLGSLRMVPTRNGGWTFPGDSYWRSESLVNILGDANQLWLDESRIPDKPSVHAFLDIIGIQKTAAAQHLVERIVTIANSSPPDDDARTASSEAFYALCDNYDERKEKPVFQEAIAKLRQATCLPADGDSDAWYPPSSLYAPFRVEAFQSQALILAFRSTRRLNTALLEAVGITINPSTRLVLDHLKHCMAHGVAPHQSTYQVLNERAQVSDPLVSELGGTQCIYVGDRFVRTNQVYWVTQKLGRYAFTVPDSIKPFMPLFSAIGVKDAPDCSDYVDILLDLAGEHYKKSEPVVGTERAVYDTCLAAIAIAHEGEKCSDEDIQRLAKAPTILNLAGMARFADEILIHDSEWYADFFNGEIDQALCRLPIEHWALAEALGARRLSESARVDLDYVCPPEREETVLAERIIERDDIFSRLLHDKPASVQERVTNALVAIEIVSGEYLSIKASIELGGDSICAPPSRAPAFYDGDNGRLTVCRPINRRSWAPILNAVFHHLMPDASGGEISKLNLSVSPLMEMDIQEAHFNLTAAGVPNLAHGPVESDPTDLASQEIGDIGMCEAEASEEETSGTDRSNLAKDATNSSPPHGIRDTSREERRGVQGVADDRREMLSNLNTCGEEREGTLGNEHSRAPENPSASMTRPEKKARPAYKKQWDRRLLSYVRQKPAEPSESEGAASESLEHNLAVEAIARDAVCSYEKERGRFPEQQAQTHPGYDIVSRNPVSGKDRLIEVKSVSGGWNQTGVGLSRLQFSNAQDYGDEYWLYVVEFVKDPKRMCIHAIQSPATKVTSFMFDGNWREAAAAERADPTMRFIPGVRVHHESLGAGKILDVHERGVSKLLNIWFDRTQQAVPNVPLDMSKIHILEEDSDNCS